MWEYFVILFLSIIDMINAQTTAFTIKSNLQFAVNKWCLGGTDRINIEDERPSGCSTNPDINCYGPIAGK